MEFSFQSALGIDLEAVWSVMSWRRFRTLIAGLLSTDTPLSRFFAPDPEPEVPHG